MAAEGGKEKLRQRLLARYSLRLHVSLLLVATAAVGALSSKILLWAGIESMLWRYPLALLIGYLGFFGFVRLWLRQVGCLRDHSAQLREQAAKPGERSGIDPADLDVGLFDGKWSTGSPGGSDTFKGGGGQFGGGGASASFAGDGRLPTPTLALSSAPPRSSGSGVGKLFGDLDLDLGDTWPLVLAIVVLLLVAGGAFVYVVYAGPGVLVDAAFEASLAGGLIRAGKETAGGDWMGSVLRATWIPFALVLTAALAFAWVAAIYAPAANTFGQVFVHILAHG